MSIFYVDVETTGLNPEKHYITQIACIVDTGKKVEEFEVLITPPFFPPSYDIEVGKITGLTRDILENNGMSVQEAFDELIEFICKYVTPRSKKKKIHICGKNVNFDKSFLEVFFDQNESKFIDYFYPTVIDIDSIVAFLESQGKIELKGHRLESYADAFGVKLENAHNALFDVRATRDIFKRALNHIDFINNIEESVKK